MASALQLAALLMDKLPAIFGPHFLKEGVVHAIDQVGCPCSLMSPFLRFCLSLQQSVSYCGATERILSSLCSWQRPCQKRRTSMRSRRWMRNLPQHALAPLQRALLTGPLDVSLAPVASPQAKCGPYTMLVIVLR